MMKQRRRLIGRVRKAEMVPALVDEALRRAPARRAPSACCLASRIPLIGGQAASRGMLRVDEIGDQQRAAGDSRSAAAL